MTFADKWIQLEKKHYPQWGYPDSDKYGICSLEY